MILSIPPSINSLHVCSVRTLPLTWGLELWLQRSSGPPKELTVRLGSQKCRPIVVILVLSLRYGVRREPRGRSLHSTWAWALHVQRRKSERELGNLNWELRFIGHVRGLGPVWRDRDEVGRKVPDLKESCVPQSLWGFSREVKWLDWWF